MKNSIAPAISQSLPDQEMDASVEQYENDLAKRVLRKIDWRLIPLMFMTYNLNFMDKTVLSSASVFGLREDTVCYCSTPPVFNSTIPCTDDRPTELEGSTVLLGVQYLLFRLLFLGVPNDLPDHSTTCGKVPGCQHVSMGYRRNSHGCLQQLRGAHHGEIPAWCRRINNHSCLLVHHKHLVGVYTSLQEMFSDSSQVHERRDSHTYRAVVCRQFCRRPSCFLPCLRVGPHRILTRTVGLDVHRSWVLDLSLGHSHTPTPARQYCHSKVSHRGRARGCSSSCNSFRYGQYRQHQVEA
jgi:hypothetical protein